MWIAELCYDVESRVNCCSEDIDKLIVYYIAEGYVVDSRDDTGCDMFRASNRYCTVYIRKHKKIV